MSTDINEMLDFCIKTYTIKDTLELLSSVNKDIKYLIVNNNSIYGNNTSINKYLNENDNVELYFKNKYILKKRIKAYILHNNKNIKYSFTHYFGDNFQYVAKLIMTKYCLYDFKFKVITFEDKLFIIGNTKKLLIYIDNDYLIIKKDISYLKNLYPNYKLLYKDFDLLDYPNYIQKLDHGSEIKLELKYKLITIYLILNYKIYKIIKINEIPVYYDIIKHINLDFNYTLKLGNIILNEMNICEIMNGSIIHIIHNM